MTDNRFGVVRSAKQEKIRENRMKNAESATQNLGKLLARALRRAA
jgi:hypothetical protein